MCTVSIVPHDRGFRLMCNRDERRTRRPAAPPMIQRVGPRTAVFPVDGDAGGTWVGANDAGVAMALLNRTLSGDASSPAAGAPKLRSRGVIVPLLLGASQLTGVLSRARLIDRGRFLPFRFIAGHRQRLLIVTASAMEWRVEWIPLDGPVMLTSSSLGDDLVEGPRRRLFDRLMQGGRDHWLQAQRRFHGHTWKNRPHVSVLMTRRDARTVSRTVVDVKRGHVTMAYEAVRARRKVDPA